jgi:lysine 2,3-aminomutase
LQRGIPVSNQAVLLRGVNDSLATLVELCNRLQAIMVRPYYLFHGDPVAGTAHLRTDLDTSRSLARGLRERLGGLACPRVVADVPGAPCKVAVEGISERSGDPVE